jgi:hypothetical protein
MKVEAGVCAVGGSVFSAFGFIRLASLVIKFTVIQYTVSRPLLYLREAVQTSSEGNHGCYGNPGRPDGIASGGGGVAMSKCVALSRAGRDAGDHYLPAKFTTIRVSRLSRMG